MDVAWSYEQPLEDAVAITGLVAFWDEQVDVYLDGERRDRPGGPISAALRDEFGVSQAAGEPADDRVPGVARAGPKGPSDADEAT